jgi:hypothetical protein
LPLTETTSANDLFRPGELSGLVEATREGGEGPKPWHSALG